MSMSVKWVLLGMAAALLFFMLSLYQVSQHPEQGWEQFWSRWQTRFDSPQANQPDSVFVPSPTQSQQAYPIMTSGDQINAPTLGPTRSVDQPDWLYPTARSIEADKYLIVDSFETVRQWYKIKLRQPEYQSIKQSWITTNGRGVGWLSFTYHAQRVSLSLIQTEQGVLLEID